MPSTDVRAIGSGLIVGAAVLIRIIVGAHSYSGANDPPRFGDYEAQRHWMEITLNTPLQEWYVNTTDNDLDYWGLDYPPGSAYQSLVHGMMVRAIEPGAVALLSSKGYESRTSKAAMRATVLLSDVLIMFPACMLALSALGSGARTSRRHWCLALILFHPAFVLVDHGHFQYNCISLGLTAAGFAAICKGRPFVGSFLFVLAINHKHMSMYHAPAFFAHLLGWCLRGDTAMRAFGRFASLGAVVLLTFAGVWIPFLVHPQSALAVLLRLVPVRRGVFEDYVANFWCVSHVFIKWKRLFEPHDLVRMCSIATLACCVPSMLHQITRPSKRGFLMSMINTSLAFYLFGYQVHEKSILLACLPCVLLSLEDGVLATYFACVASASMFPLWKKDGLTRAYFACQAMLLAIGFWDLRRNTQDRFTLRCFVVSLGVLLVTHAIDLCLEPPESFPYAFDLMISAISFVHFVGFAISYNVKLWLHDPGEEAKFKRL